MNHQLDFEIRPFEIDLERHNLGRSGRWIQHGSTIVVLPDTTASPSEGQEVYELSGGSISSATPRVLTYWTKDVIDKRISVPAQHSLVRLSKNPATNAEAVGLLEEVKAGRLAAIYCVNWQKPAQRALVAAQERGSATPPSRRSDAGPTNGAATTRTFGRSFSRPSRKCALKALQARSAETLDRTITRTWLKNSLMLREAKAGVVALATGRGDPGGGDKQPWFNLVPENERAPQPSKEFLYKLDIDDDVLRDGVLERRGNVQRFPVRATVKSDNTVGKRVLRSDRDAYVSRSQRLGSIGRH
jgi:hypothetical protein